MSEREVAADLIRRLARVVCGEPYTDGQRPDLAGDLMELHDDLIGGERDAVLDGVVALLSEYVAGNVADA